MTDAATIAALKTAAFAALEHAYAPYSKFRVVAALLTASGEIVAGCNVENSSYPAGTCAERVALGSAVARGLRHFTHCVVVSEAATPTPPCGICRQALWELAPDCLVTSITRGGLEAQWRLADLLPHPFMPSSLHHE
jgi:cytidine deaminase